MNQHTSLKLSKKLEDNNCDLETTKYIYEKYRNSITNTDNGCYATSDGIGKPIKAYDLVWDVCIRYAKEFFGEGKENGFTLEPYETICWNIMGMLQQGKPQKEIEKYIEDNCVFLKKIKVVKLKKDEIVYKDEKITMKAPQKGFI